MRCLIFIVTYNAGRLLVDTLQRIPQEMWDDENVHVLCIDDSSQDDSVELAATWVHTHEHSRVTLLRNRRNLGYGGNQKLGYRIAIQNGFDFVVLLHGDAQYAPEMLPRFIAEWKTARADVVLGTRMKDLSSARRGGMPFYKMVGNRVLTLFQNLMTGSSLSEYHTGYRGYSTNFLRRARFELNSNSFHFDTEILYQALALGVNVSEFPIPTHYGDEVCHVQGFRYAWNVCKTTLEFRLGQMGLFCSLKFRNLRQVNYVDKTGLRYSSHSCALRLVDKHQPKRLLDLGCGPGFVARACKDRGIEVHGVDRDAPQAGSCDRFYSLDLEREKLPVDPFTYDVVLLLDVIEHHENPEEFLLTLRHQTEVPEEQLPPVILSTPNIAFWMIRLNLLFGRFNYADRGILDFTHKRLFTKQSLLHMLDECGYRVESVHPVGMPAEAVLPKPFGAWLGRLSDWLARLWPSLMAFQFMIVCRPRAGVAGLLKNAESVTGINRLAS